MSFSWANFITLILAVGGAIYLTVLHNKLRIAKNALRAARNESLALFDQTKSMCHDTLTTAQTFTSELYAYRQEDIKQYTKALAATMQLLNEIDAARSMVAKELENQELGGRHNVVQNKLRFIETHCQEARVILGNVSFADVQATMERLHLAHEREAQLFNRLINRVSN
ncbi:hypothetical protein O152_gp009 [Pseudomonas phage PaBG]|uniref:Uncharacterized protein n=1 Tax=Pseudomonas phage PaBG TaxID=1335230 RepID=S5WAZ7_9CAUD|nr:hypothetical protein O152_gp009 [Pseudomonas phage PaBG]AGS81893.1 hypothetical protein PaBG_00009 [Pseudomonas phage PaBG]